MMTKFRITPAKSVSTTANGDHAFDGDSAGPDTLTVDHGAFLVTQGFGANGAYLANTGGWTVNVNGSIVADDGFGIFLAAGNAEVSKITVDSQGQVSGYSDGIVALSSAIITNFGVITATALNSEGIGIGGTGLSSIKNVGTITAHYAINSGGGQENVTNSGVLNGYVSLGGGSDQLNNSGLIALPDSGSMSLVDGDDRLTNSGQIISTSGIILLGEGDDRLTNSGLINLGGGLDFVDLGTGNNVLVNSGTIENYVSGGENRDAVQNSGVINDNIDLDAGADIFTNYRMVDGVMVSGIVTGTIYLSEGNDRFYGGGYAETVADHDGADIVSFGAGDDVYRASHGGSADGRDMIGGGAGVDTYDASGTGSGVLINLDAVAHDLPFTPGAVRVAARTASGVGVSGTSTDQITSFENAFGGSAGDTIYGSSLGNYIDGGGGTDNLCGFGGNDYLTGGASLDNLVGGAGRDTLSGGADADTFHFAKLVDSGPTAAARDVIIDFDINDVIALDQLDAIAGTPVDDAFTFIGTNVIFGGNAGELRAYWSAAGQIVEGDVNGDRVADFSIAINDAGHSIVLTGSDFLL